MANEYVCRKACVQNAGDKKWNSYCLHHYESQLNMEGEEFLMNIVTSSFQSFVRGQYLDMEARLQMEQYGVEYTHPTEQQLKSELDAFWMKLLFDIEEYCDRALVSAIAGQEECSHGTFIVIYDNIEHLPTPIMCLSVNMTSSDTPEHTLCNCTENKKCYEAYKEFYAIHKLKIVNF